MRRIRVASLVCDMDSHDQGHLASTRFQTVQVLMSRGWLTELFGDGVNDCAYAQEGKRRYCCGLLRRDVAATCCEQDPCTELCDVEFCFVSDLGWRLQDILRFLRHRSLHAFNPRVKTSTCCQMEWWIRSSTKCTSVCLIFRDRIQVVQYSTNLMRSFCVSLVFTMT